MNKELSLWMFSSIDEIIDFDFDFKKNVEEREYVKDTRIRPTETFDDFGKSRGNDKK